MRLIDADALKETIDREIFRHDTIDHVFQIIDDAPTIEPKRGEWIFKTIFPNDKSEFPMGYLECSACGSHHRNATPCNYCDNCGAEMREREGE